MSHIIVIVFINLPLFHSFPTGRHFDNCTPSKRPQSVELSYIYCNRSIFYDHLNRWSGFEECVEGLQKWLKEAEASLPTEPELKATLDEKRAQLQVYRCDSKPLLFLIIQLCDCQINTKLQNAGRRLSCHGNRLSIDNKTNETFLVVSTQTNHLKGLSNCTLLDFLPTVNPFNNFFNKKSI